jgi:hypothetical protein
MPIALAPLWLGLATQAHAGQVVVHEGDPAQAVDEVAKRTGQPATEFTATTLADVLNGKLPSISAGKIERCTTGPAPAADVEKHLGAAQESIDAKDYEFALGPAKAAEKAALCADAPVSGPVLARVAFAGGVAAHANGDVEGAKAAFRQAWELDPATDWTAKAPDAMKPDARIAGELAQKPDATLWLVPSDGASVDGKPATGHPAVAAGTHWVELAGVWMRVTVDAGTAPVLVVPAAIPPGATAWAADPAKSGDLARLLDTLAPSATYVVTGDDVYKRSGGVGWEPVEMPKKHFEAGVVVAPIGGVIAVTGAVLAFTALGAGNDALDTATTPGVSQADFDAAHSDYDGAKTRLIVGDVLIASGVVLAGIGGGMLLDGAAVAPYLVPGGGGIGVSVGGGR